MSLVARHLEANGIPTLCLGSAFDILDAGRPPRAVFLDYPLGHSAGKPFDTDDQYDVIKTSLAALAGSRPGEMTILPNRWGTEGAWRDSASSTEGSDTRQPRDETPQFQHAADRRAAIASGALAG
ncbi:MAG: hypothetical protein ACREXT_02380 [Gammaproteobacteria bacterium]